MKLSQLLGVDLKSEVIHLVGAPEETSILNRDGIPYYVVKLAKPITVRCSVNPEILPHEISEIYVLKSAFDLEGWKYVDDTKRELGYYMPDWVADFSPNQKIALYQATSIRAWLKEDRTERRTRDTNATNASILAMLEAAKKKASGA